MNALELINYLLEHAHKNNTTLSSIEIFYRDADGEVKYIENLEVYWKNIEIKL